MRSWRFAVVAPQNECGSPVEEARSLCCGEQIAQPTPVPMATHVMGLQPGPSAHPQPKDTGPLPHTEGQQEDPRPEPSPV